MSTVRLAMSIAEQHQRELRSDAAEEGSPRSPQCCPQSRMAAFLPAAARHLLNLRRSTGPATLCCA
jgi:hypothetical protein